MADLVRTRDVTKASTEDLEEEAADLAELRTKVRLRQNEVNAELDIRRQLDKLPEEARRIVYKRLEGGIGPTGGVNDAEED